MERIPRVAQVGQAHQLPARQQEEPLDIPRTRKHRFTHHQWATQIQIDQYLQRTLLEIPEHTQRLDSLDNLDNLDNRTITKHRQMVQLKAIMVSNRVNRVCNNRSISNLHNSIPSCQRMLLILTKFLSCSKLDIKRINEMEIA
jgi:hypothetical protein